MAFQKGDVVKVWSLQSFSGGGFLDGVEAIVSQDQIGRSVLVAVERNIGGRVKVDPSYEVYPRQLELIHRPSNLPSNFQQLISHLKST